MNRPPFLAAALAAMALLVLGTGEALANAPGSLSIEGVESAAPIDGVESTQAPTAEPQPAPSPAPAGVPPKNGPTPDVPPGPVTADPGNPPAQAEPVVPLPPTEPQGESTSSSSTPTPAEGETPPPPDLEGSASQLDLGPGPTPVRPADMQAEVALADPRGPAPMLPFGAGASGDVPAAAPNAAASASQSGVILERLLPRVERRLRGVQTQMDDLQRRLDGGGSPPSESLVRLRRSLELIAPALAALGASADASGRLSPRLRHILSRVNTRLGDAHASAAALAAALRRSGVHGAELSLLLRELEGFQALRPEPQPNLELTAAQPPPATGVAYAHDGAFPAGSPPAPAAPPAQAGVPPRRHAAASATTATHHPVAPDELLRQTAASGSASAGPGGAFSAAGLAALAALLGLLALPRLLSRLALPPMRCYAAVFLVPLQRPG